MHLLTHVTEENDGASRRPTNSNSLKATQLMSDRGGIWTQVYLTCMPLSFPSARGRIGCMNRKKNPKPVQSSVPLCISKKL